MVQYVTKKHVEEMVLHKYGKMKKKLFLVIKTNNVRELTLLVFEILYIHSIKVFKSKNSLIIPTSWNFSGIGNKLSVIFNNLSSQHTLVWHEVIFDENVPQHPNRLNNGRR